MITSPDPALPVPAGIASGTVLVGRDRERAVLREALGFALAGRGSLVLLGGEAGIGKTALAEAICAEAEQRGATVLVGRCYDLAETPPYGPWREALERAPRDGDLHDPPDLSGGASLGQAVLFAAVLDYLSSLAACRPLIFLLDDLHWADPASLDLLRAVTRKLPATPILALVTYRAEEIVRHHPLYALLPLLVREARAVRLDLRPLAEGDIRALVRRRYAFLPPEEHRLVAYLSARAEGNPFYAGELLRALEEEGALARSATRWELGDLAAERVPSLLRQVLDARIDRLGDASRALLTAAAVLGQIVPLDLWGTLAGVAEDNLLALVERAVAARLLDETVDGAAVRFRHALIRAALYEGLGVLRRRTLHRRAADALLAAPAPDPDAVAYHLRQAGDPRATEWLLRAGERALRAHAWDSAAERFEAALARLEGDEHAAERGWLLLRLGLLRRFGDPALATAHLGRAIETAAAIGDALLRAQALYNWGQVRLLLRDQPGGLPAMGAGVAALEALLPLDTAQRTRLERAGLAADPDHHRATLALWLAYAGDFARAQALADVVAARPRAIAPASAIDGAGAHDVHYALGFIHSFRGHPTEARRSLARWTAHADANGNLWNVFLGRYDELRVVIDYQTDDLAARTALAEQAEQAWVRASGTQIGDSLPAHFARLPLLLIEARWDGLLAWATREVAREHVAFTTFIQSFLAQLARAQGDPAFAWSQVRAILPDGADTPPGATFFLDATMNQRAAAALAIDAGDLAAARGWLAAHDRWLDWAGATLGRVEGHLGWAAYHRLVGDRARAHEHAERALRQASDPRQPLALLATHRLLGELHTAEGRHTTAAAHLDTALALADACHAPYERALTLLALGDLRHNVGERDVARSLLGEARAILDTLAAKPALARVDALATRMGDAPPAPGSSTRPATPFGLSAREQDVLHLLAEGLTDPQIAERLFISRHTVNTHLRAIYGKLGVTSRAAAARRAAEHGLA